MWKQAHAKKCDGEGEEDQQVKDHALTNPLDLIDANVQAFAAEAYSHNAIKCRPTAAG